MGIINILDKQTANLIAAGEVVERPSSAIKEMLENCADAGATSVTVEIKNGGTSFIRITDNGKGMSRDDVPKAIMRHATSKIKDGRDLESIGTFGFRGEALAAISSVSTMRILTRQKGDVSGTLFECQFGEQTILEDAGCPEGTTITVENIFENVPARRKFLKKDSTEALSVGAICEKFALSRPEIAVTLISDNNTKMQSPGDGNLKSAIYASLGREFASKLLPVDYSFSGVRIHGFIGKPEFCRPNRNMQNFFVNNRYIRSKTMLAATEEGFRGFCPVGKFPACVLFCDIDLRMVDVNVHPAKLEIKFSDERKIFDSVYFAVKNALSSGSTFKEFEISEEPIATDNTKKDEIKPQENKQEEQYHFPPASVSPMHAPISSSPSVSVPKTIIKDNSNAFYIPDGNDGQPTTKTDTKAVSEYKDESVKPVQSFDKPTSITDKTPIKITEPEPTIHHVPTPVQNEVKKEIPKEETATRPPVTQCFFPPVQQEEIVPASTLQKPVYVGEIFSTYILAQYKNSLYIIDKHAAHERILYEKLKNPDYDNCSQFLLEPINVTVTPKEAEAALENKDYFTKIGFEFDEFGMNTFIIRALPTPIHQAQAKDVFTYLAGKLSEGNSRSAGEIFDRALFTAACRAAIKGGDKNTDYDNKQIIEEIFTKDAVLYCPHGRPVISEFSKDKLEKMFDRQ